MRSYPQFSFWIFIELVKIYISWIIINRGKNTFELVGTVLKTPPRSLVVGTASNGWLFMVSGGREGWFFRKYTVNSLLSFNFILLADDHWENMKKSGGCKKVLFATSCYIRRFFSRYFSLRVQSRSMWKKEAQWNLEILPFQSFYFFNIWSFLKSLFWMKQIQGRVKVKINEYVHAWSKFLFVSLPLIFNFFPQINHFYYFRSQHGLQDV